MGAPQKRKSKKIILLYKIASLYYITFSIKYVYLHIIQYIISLNLIIIEF